MKLADRERFATSQLQHVKSAAYVESLIGTIGINGFGTIREPSAEVNRLRLADVAAGPDPVPQHSDSTAG